MNSRDIDLQKNVEFGNAYGLQQMKKQNPEQFYNAIEGAIDLLVKRAEKNPDYVSEQTITFENLKFLSHEGYSLYALGQLLTYTIEEEKDVDLAQKAFEQANTYYGFERTEGDGGAAIKERLDHNAKMIGKYLSALEVKRDALKST